MIKKSLVVLISIILSTSLLSLISSVDQKLTSNFILILVQIHENINLTEDIQNEDIENMRILVDTEYKPDQLATPELSKNWKSLISYEDRKYYEDLLLIKKSFQVSLPFLPQEFHPESKTYYDQINTILFGFLIVSGVVTLLVLTYLAMRFCCNKCIGPIKSSQITKSYRNLTWIFMSTYYFNF
jgi:hypothetical protein